MSQKARRFNQSIRHQIHGLHLAEMLQEQQQAEIDDFATTEHCGLLENAPSWRIEDVNDEVENFIHQCIQSDLSTLEVIQEFVEQDQSDYRGLELALGLAAELVSGYRILSQAYLAAQLATDLARHFPQEAREMKLAAYGWKITGYVNISINVLIDIAQHCIQNPSDKKLFHWLFEYGRQDVVFIANDDNGSLWRLIDLMDSSSIKPELFARFAYQIDFSKSDQEIEHQVEQLRDKEIRQMHCSSIWQNNSFINWMTDHYTFIGSGYYQSNDPKDYNIYDRPMLAEAWEEINKISA